MKKTRENGVTLIVLVITVIVIILLSGIILYTLSGENNIFENAVYAKFSTEIKAIEEQIKLKLFDENYNVTGKVNEKLNIESKYNDLLYIQEGELVYIYDKASAQEKEWLEKSGINSISPIFKIEFETAGGTEIQPQNVNAGQKATKPENPVKSGSEFIYWYYEKNVGTEDNPSYQEEIFNFDNEIKQDYTLFAKYTGEAVLTEYKNNNYFWQYKNEITSISFEKGDMTIPQNALYSWNIEKNSKSYPIVAYIINNETNETNDSFRLIVRCDKDIYASTSLQAYFKDFTKAKKIELNNFDTSKTVNMGSVFYCTNDERTYALEKITFGEKFRTSNVTDMRAMFRGCGNLTDLDVSNFDTSNVETMEEMFCRCYKLETIDVSNFDTSNVKYMGYMFYMCHSIKKIDACNFNTSNVTDMRWLFHECKSAETIDVSSFDTRNVTNMRYMFSHCDSLTYLDLNRFDISNVTNTERMFNSCYELTNVILNEFDASKSANFSGMFYECKKLTNLDLSKFIANDVTDMNQMFYNCQKLTNIDLSNFNTSNVTNMSLLFYRCISLESVNLGSFNTSNVTDMSRMFSQCESLKTVNVSAFDTSKVENMRYMFENSPKLTTIYASEKFVTANVKDSTNMFTSSGKIKGGNGTTYNSSKTDKTYACIDKEGRPGYFTDEKQV